ncbi:MAG TPA: hypothetical protein VMH83_11295 [Candidatus Acidoferrum sp.]|nr:hypothetical protein [Candidatus Acidoferrum sp.]
MNTYNENLQSTVTTVLSGMQQEKAALESANVAAEYKLYFAQSANITANEKLNKLNEQSSFIGLMNNQGVENDNLSKNLLNTVIKASTTVAGCVTDTSTAASNIQIAATAISQVAADIGSAYNLVSAEDNNSDIYRLISKANDLIRKVSYRAERMSEQAMLASADTAEIRTSQLLSETNVVKSGIENLLAVTEAEFTGLMAQKTVDTQNADTTSSAEKECEGLLLDSQTEYKAVKKAYRKAKEQLNYDLRVKPVSLTSANIKFSPFVQPFKPEKTSVPNYIPDANPVYYALVVPAERAILLNIEKAELLFAEFRKQRFIPVTPTVKTEAADGQGEQEPGYGSEHELVFDSEGERVKPGVSYVVFLYIAVAQAYKKYINNFDDLLSAPSDAFVLTQDLPQAKNIRVPPPPAPAPAAQGKAAKTEVAAAPAPSAPPGTLWFNVPGPLFRQAEYRMILLPADTPKTQRFMTANPKDRASQLDFYFNLAIALQVTPDNYTVATVAPQPGSSPAKGELVYQARLDGSTTDNFGSQVEVGRVYIPAVLSVIPDGSQAAQYNAVVSDYDGGPRIKFNKKFEVQVVTSN